MLRRSFLRGLIAAPAVVAVGSLMPIRGIVMSVGPYAVFDLLLADGTTRRLRFEAPNTPTLINEAMTVVGCRLYAPHPLYDYDLREIPQSWSNGFRPNLKAGETITLQGPGAPLWRLA